MSTKITNLRGSMVTPIHRGSVLLFKQEDLCSTSYESLLFEKEEHFHSTSHGKDPTPVLESLNFEVVPI